LSCRLLRYGPRFQFWERFWERWRGDSAERKLPPPAHRWVRRGIDMPGLERSLGWDFSQGTHGFAAINGVAPLRVIDGALRVSVIGFDPYVHSPPVDLVGERDRWMHVRLRATQGEQLKIYFTTPTGGGPNPAASPFPSLPTGSIAITGLTCSSIPAGAGPSPSFVSTWSPRTPKELSWTSSPSSFIAWGRR